LKLFDVRMNGGLRIQVVHDGSFSLKGNDALSKFGSAPKVLIRYWLGDRIGR
jgi:hypothetical protein